MLSSEQQEQYSAFVSNFVQQLHRAGFAQVQAKLIADRAAATLLHVVMGVEPGGYQGTDSFAGTVLRQAIEQWYPHKEVDLWDRLFAPLRQQEKDEEA